MSVFLCESSPLSVGVIINGYALAYAESLPVYWFNSSPPGQNGRHFADDNFNRIFLKWLNFNLIFTEICSQESN